MDDGSNNLPADAGVQVDAARRSALVAMARGLAYVPPVVATFAMGGMSARASATKAYVTNLL
jgi:hypothetical protein